VSVQFDSSRRGFLVSVTIAGGALPTWRAMSSIVEAGALATPSACVPVVSFHMDQPYLDLTGTGTPYVQPQGARSAEPLGACDDVLLRYLHCYAT
jgi:hypothetical protein